MGKYRLEDFTKNIEFSGGTDAEKLRYDSILNIANMTMNIANELAESNRLKKMELEIEINRLRGARMRGKIGDAYMQELGCTKPHPLQEDDPDYQ